MAWVGCATVLQNDVGDVGKHRGRFLETSVGVMTIRAFDVEFK
jgi:hypothetical protein